MQFYLLFFYNYLFFVVKLVSACFSRLLIEVRSMMKKVDKSSLHYWQTRNYELNGSSKKHDDKEREEIHFKNILQLSSMLHSKEMDSLTTSILLDEERKLHANVSKSM